MFYLFQTKDHFFLQTNLNSQLGSLDFKNYLEQFYSIKCAFQSAQIEISTFVFETVYLDINSNLNKRLNHWQLIKYFLKKNKKFK